MQGVLHGLYVFRTIEDFLKRFMMANTLDAEARAYIGERIESIDKEVAELSGLQNSAELTEAGRVLVCRLINGNIG